MPNIIEAITIRNNKYYNSKGVEIYPTEQNKQILNDLALKQITSGDATQSSNVVDNNYINPQGKVLNLSTNKYLPVRVPYSVSPNRSSVPPVEFRESLYR